MALIAWRKIDIFAMVSNENREKNEGKNPENAKNLKTLKTPRIMRRIWRIKRGMMVLLLYFVVIKDVETRSSACVKLKEVDLGGGGLKKEVEERKRRGGRERSKVK